MDVYHGIACALAKLCKNMLICFLCTNRTNRECLSVLKKISVYLGCIKMFSCIEHVQSCFGVKFCKCNCGVKCCRHSLYFCKKFTPWVRKMERDGDRRMVKRDGELGERGRVRFTTQYLQLNCTALHTTFHFPILYH